MPLLTKFYDRFMWLWITVINLKFILQTWELSNEMHVRDFLSRCVVSNFIIMFLRWEKRYLSAKHTQTRIFDRIIFFGRYIYSMSVREKRLTKCPMRYERTTEIWLQLPELLIWAVTSCGYPVILSTRAALSTKFLDSLIFHRTFG